MSSIERKRIEDTILLGSCQDIAPILCGIDVVLTSPFYNTAPNKVLVEGEKRYRYKNSRQSQYARYDTIVDNLTNEEYCEFMVGLFNKLHGGLKDTGSVLFNISYSAKNTHGYILAISEIIKHTEFTLVDQITWRKPRCIPDISSTNRLTRIGEPIFVFCKKGFEKSFHMNKIETNRGNASHKCYKPIWNVIDADVSEGRCPFNKATYSVDLCKQLLRIYAPDGGLVYDPFMGSGTTAVACKELGLHYVGSEISENQVNWANDRIRNTNCQLKASS